MVCRAGEGGDDANVGVGGKEEVKEEDTSKKKSPFFNILAEWTWGQVHTYVYTHYNDRTNMRVHVHVQSISSSVVIALPKMQV